jgi:DNA-binding MarR family transcriptional regulator
VLDKKSTKHVTAPEDRLAHIVRDAGRNYMRALQNRLEKYDISFGHWAILRVLWEEQGITQKDISLRTGLMEPTVHQALVSLENQAIIQRQRVNGNQKKWHVFLTSKGTLLRKKLEPLALEVNQLAETNISVNNLEITRKVLLQIIENLENKT